MRVVATALLMLIEGQILATACMKNYGGPTCKTEYQMCMKSCGKKSPVEYCVSSTAAKLDDSALAKRREL